MLALFRRSQRVLLILLLIVIIVAFVFWGSRPGDFNWSAAPARIVGKIGAREIKETDISYAIRGVLISLALRGISRDMITDNRELERDAWYQLAQTEAAKRAGLVVSPQELESAVRNIFFRNSPFDRAAYRAMISRIAGAMTEREFENHLSDLILSEKIRQALAATVVVTDQDIRQAYEADRTLIKLAYVPFFSSNYVATQTVSTNEIEEFYKANENIFKKPAQVDLILAVAPLSPDSVSIDDEEIAAYYDDNKEKFAITNAPASATNDTGSAVEPVKEYYELADVAATIRTNLIHAKASEISYDTAEQLSFALAGPAARTSAERATLFLEKAAALGLSTLETGWLALDDDVPGISNAYALVRAAFSLKPGELTDVTEVPGTGHVLVFVRDKRDEYLPPLEDIVDDVRAEIASRRALDAARLAASQLKSMLDTTGQHLTNAAAMGFTVVTTVPLDRHTGLDDIGCPPEVVAHLFAYPEHATVVAPFKDGFMLATPLEIIDADLDLLSTDPDEQAKLAERLTRQAENVLFNMWFQQAWRAVEVRHVLYTDAHDQLPQE